MKLVYDGKRNESDIIDSIPSCHLKSIYKYTGARSKLIKGDNLQVLKYLLDAEGLKGKIGMIYIDPPFATNNTFHIGKDKANTISGSLDDNIAYSDDLTGDQYIEFIRERLILLKELLADHGSIYFHIDYKVGHYIKIVMDEIFGENHFINDISRIKCNPKNFKRKAFGNVKDMILLYSKTNKYTWNEQRAEFDNNDISTLFKKIDQNGRRYTTIPVHAPGETKNGATGKMWRGMLPPKGRHWRSDPVVLDELDKNGLIEWSKNGVPRKIIYADEKKEDGKKLQDILEYKDSQNPTYPTEKNLELLKLLIKTSSNPGDIVLDCFCGSGTTLKAAQELERYWIGIDQSDYAILTALKRLKCTQKTLNPECQEFDYLEAY